MVYTTPSQIGAIVPSNTPEGAATVTVTYNNQTSRPANVRIVRALFAAFARNSQDSRPASAENASQQGRPINGGGGSETDAVGPFQTSIGLSAATVWSNINEVSPVRRYRVRKDS